MDIYIVIPAHNEEDFIQLTLESLAKQTLLPKQVVVVNDNSTDDTQIIVEKLSNDYNWITLINSNSSDQHIPGAKIINAFYKGYDILDDNYDIICKFDADLVFPDNYLETLASHFTADNKLGMAAGFCYIEKNNDWVIEGLTNKDHIRGALKAYRKECFLEIGKLKLSMGWDTVDELLAQYYGWQLKTDETLKVKHLKPTGSGYVRGAKYLQGEALYKLRFGLPLAFLSALKLAFKKRSFLLFKDYIFGYLKASINKNIEFLITPEQGRFVRRLRWKGITKKLFNS
ncbi:glycosyltransferase [Flavobacteriaceae bacterium AU392]|nr:glycosyltransferase family 2 protein [Flavobacteriaceae bacterium]RKM81663.1 glycosyltransferase [Flavobacteriaceae bacterium AU392]